MKAAPSTQVRRPGCSSTEYCARRAAESMPQRDSRLLLPYEGGKFPSSWLIGGTPATGGLVRLTSFTRAAKSAQAL